ncbi:MAG TPA: EamA family transporter RarD [Bdellovibrionales bacterium]|nr:EamA family transporter RarD [Bdellovibrionales bacterium]
MPDSNASDSRTSGTLYALGAYTLWGFFPIYWKFLTAFSSLELIAHRLIWAFLFYLFLSWHYSKASGRQSLTRWIDIFRNRETGFAVMAASVLLTTNWLLYIYAVNSGQVVEASLGYFITPLFNVLTGWLVLRETLSRTRWISIALAAIGVSMLAFQADHFPWIALSLATTFSLYGLIRKRLKVSVFDASTAETATLVVPAAIFVIYSRFFAPGHHDATHFEFTLLALSGVVTGLPLIWFAQAAIRLPLSKLGFFQYIAPTIQFLLGVFIYNEPFSSTKLWSFAFIWLALAVFSWETLRRNHGPKKAT